MTTAGSSVFIEGGNTMKRMIRSLRPTLGKGIVLCAFALTLAGDTSLAFNSQEPGGAERQRRRRQNELTFAQFDFPGAIGTAAFGVNDRGQIVGLFTDAGGVTHGFLLDKGVFTQIDAPGSTETQTTAINDRGQIVGLFFDAGGVSHGFILDNGAFTQIDFPGATVTELTDINDRGQIAGAFDDAGGIRRGFLLERGVFTPINVPDAMGTEPFGINDRGQVTGLFLDAGAVIRRFLLDKGVFSQIDIPGETTMPVGDPREAIRINNRGQIVTSFQDTGKPPLPGVQPVHGILIEDGAFTQIDFPGAIATETLAINDRSQIVGGFVDAGVAIHGFLATNEQFSGKATGVSAGAENATVEIVGTFTSPTDLDLSTATLSITNLLNERTGSGEIISRQPLVLTAAPGGRRNFAVFVDRSRPNLASVTIDDAGPGKFNFKIKVDDATINSSQNCSPIRLTTGFRLDAANNPPIIVSTERSWDCLGPSNQLVTTH
jgi:probable HAF family extracellular repeat protein